MEELAVGNKVILPTLGTLKLVAHKARRMGNLHRGEIMTCPSRIGVKLQSSSYLKDAMKKLHEIDVMNNLMLFK